MVVLYMSKNTPPNNTGKEYKKTAAGDMRPAIFKAHYINPSSDTFMNVLQSALRAGYSQEYSESLGYQNPKWFAELLEDNDVRRAKMLRAAESALDRAIAYDDEDSSKASLKLKAATFVTERLGKEHYSTRQEVTGADGRRLFDNETREESAVDLQNLFAGVKDAD
jgi:hypothetical protein